MPTPLRFGRLGIGARRLGFGIKPPATTSSRNTHLERQLISRLRVMLVKTIALLTLGMIALSYGYGNDNAPWWAVSSLSVFFAFCFLSSPLR
ncbi:MAG: hypothetical protein ACFCVD_07100 [Nodosilinea sp.]